LEKEDRYIFLEALLSARDVFYVSYIGQDIQDNSIRQPSVIVTELLDYIEKGYILSTHLLIPSLERDGKPAGNPSEINELTPHSISSPTL
jgi:exonuclease V gamma subunit